MGDEMGLGKTVQVIAFLAGLNYSKLLSRHGRLVLLSVNVSYWIVGSKELSNVCFFSVLEVWDQVSSYAPPQWCISGCGNSMYGGHISELLSSMSLAPSMVRTIVHCLVYGSWKFFAFPLHSGTSVIRLCFLGWFVSILNLMVLSVVWFQKVGWSWTMNWKGYKRKW